MRHSATHSQRPPQGHPLQYATGTRNIHLVARAVAPDVTAEQAPGAGDNPLSFEPEELVLGPGELSPMNRKPSDEAFQCTGCMDAACQVPTCLLLYIFGVLCCSEAATAQLLRAQAIEWNVCRGRQAVIRRLGGLMNQGICGPCSQLVYTT